MLGALGWGLVAASSLVLGGVLALVRRWPDGLIGAVLGFGAGALIASVSFELAEEGVHSGGPWAVAVGLAVGALTFFGADRAVTRLGGRTRKRDGEDGDNDHAGGAPRGGSGGAPRGPSSAGQGGAGATLALGALLDGVPEQLVLGIGLAQGEGLSLALLVAIFVSNLPEAIGSSADMRAAGQSKARILALWAIVALICAAATVCGYAVAEATSAELKAAINGFAAGALLVMLVDSMVPEAREKEQDKTGLFTVVGFALSAGLSLLG
ncbi:MAG: ZIP family metal transporter [Austwickia sp.]|nr:MAG: ZIP family metal transporter [Austwickia sp.]